MPAKHLEVEASKIVIKDRETDHEAAVHSSYQALESFKRRGLALDFAGIMTFSKHDRYVQLLFNHLNRDPPVGYSRCSVSQLLAADRAAWCSLIEVNTKPRPDAAGVAALDTKLEEALKSYEVSFTLLPAPAKQQAQKPTPTPPSTGGNHPALHQPRETKKGSTASSPMQSKEREKEGSGPIKGPPSKSGMRGALQPCQLANQSVLTSP